MYAEKIDHTCEKTWSEVDQEMSMQEAFWTSPEMEAEALQEIQDQIESRDFEHGAAVAISKIVTGKARVECLGRSLMNAGKLPSRIQS